MLSKKLLISLIFCFCLLGALFPSDSSLEKPFKSTSIEEKIISNIFEKSLSNNSSLLNENKKFIKAIENSDEYAKMWKAILEFVFEKLLTE